MEGSWVSHRRSRPHGVGRSRRREVIYRPHDQITGTARRLPRTRSDHKRPSASDMHRALNDPHTRPTATAGGGEQHRAVFDIPHMVRCGTVWRWKMRAVLSHAWGKVPVIMSVLENPTTTATITSGCRVQPNQKKTRTKGPRASTAREQEARRVHQTAGGHEAADLAQRPGAVALARPAGGVGVRRPRLYRRH